MRDWNQRRFGRQIRFLRRQFLQDNGLPFNDVLSAEIVQQALTAANVVWNDRIYTPMVTLRVLPHESPLNQWLKRFPVRPWQKLSVRSTSNQLIQIRSNRYSNSNQQLNSILSDCP